MCSKVGEHCANLHFDEVFRVVRALNVVLKYGTEVRSPNTTEVATIENLPVLCFMLQDGDLFEVLFTELRCEGPLS